MPYDIEAEHAAIENERAGIGGNNPPSPIEILRAELAESTAPLLTRAKTITDTAGQIQITDEESAGRAAALAKMARDHYNDIDNARDTKKRPLLEAGRAIDEHYRSIYEPLVGPDPKKGMGGVFAKLSAQINVYRKKKDEEAAAERRRLEEQARQERQRAEAAERAQREAEERERIAQEQAAANLRRAQEAERAAKEAGDREAQRKAQQEAADLQAQQERDRRAASARAMEAEMAATAAATKAESFEARAATTVAAPIDSGLGAKAHGKVVRKVIIEDLTLAIRHCRKVNEAPILAVVQQIYDRQEKAGVKVLPGARIEESTTTVIR